MKKAMAILVFSTVILTSCGNVSEPAENVKTSAISRTTTVTTSTSTSAKEENDTSVTTTKISTQTVFETSKPTETTTTKTTTQSSTKSVNYTASTQKSASPTQQIYYPTEQTKQQTQVTTAVQTTTVPKVETTTTTQTTTSPKVTTKPQNTVKWTDTMKAWRKLCEGKSISGSDWELVRQDIVDYGVQKFDGKTTVDLNCGIDFYTRTFQSPLNLSVNGSLKGMSHAHLDAYADPECSAMINYASSEEEIYSIVEQTRIDCLSVVDSGIESWYEFCEINDCLEYASNLEFNVGLDGTAIWFLTE
jgi:hypothetical protein